MRVFAWALAALLLVGGALYAWRASQAVDVRVAHVERGTIQLGYDEDGRVRSDVESVVAARLAGRVASLPVPDGRAVRAGQVIATLDDADLRAQIAAAEAEIARARAALDETRAAVSADVATAEADRAAAAAALEQARARSDAVSRGARSQERDRVRAQLSAAEVAVWEASRNATRAEKLYADGFISARDRDLAQSGMRQAEARLRAVDAELRLLTAGSSDEDLRAARAAADQAGAALRAAGARVDRASSGHARVAAQQAALASTVARLDQLRAQLKDVQLVSPRAGVLALGDVSVGDVIAPGQVVARVVDPSRIYVEAMIDEMDVAGVRPGLAVVITCDAWPDDTFSGRLLHVQGEAVLKRKSLGESGREDDRAFKARVSVDDPQRRLRPGMTVYVQLLTGEVRDVLTMPREALLPRGSEWVVWVVRKDRAYRALVAAGERDARRVEVKSGVVEGDAVIVSGREALSDGTRVRVENP